jgi:hypothetical protein
MAVTPTTFKARYTEFASTSDARVQVYIDDAELEMNEAQWGDLYDRGLSALTAHLLSIADKNAASGGAGTSLPGALVGRSVGSVSIQFATSASGGTSSDFYLSTAYGTDYWRLAQMVGLGIVVVDD